MYDTFTFTGCGFDVKPTDEIIMVATWKRFCNYTVLWCDHWQKLSSRYFDVW